MRMDVGEPWSDEATLWVQLGDVDAVVGLRLLESFDDRCLIRDNRHPRVISVSKAKTSTPAKKSSILRTTAVNGAAVSRARVIDATVACILELGFYRASTNEIARRAGVTWGVIQHYFGTREALMLAVLQKGAGEFVESVEGTYIEGDTIIERIEQLIDVFSAHYARPDYLANLQILLNMDRDPRTGGEVRKTMLEVAERSNVHVRRLMREARTGIESSRPIDHHFLGAPRVRSQSAAPRHHVV
jgi:AcrR family transcriptional regulator